MAKYWVSAVGRVVQGHVLDVARKPFDEALRFYDKQLYTKWNPRKLKGHGCWEIRRRPELKTVKDIVVWEGNTYVLADYYEVDILNHVLDCAFLNYDQIRKLKEMDTFENGLSRGFGAHVESWESSQREREHEKGLKAQAYAAKQHKHEIRDFKEMVLSGVNPAVLADHWEDV